MKFKHLEDYCKVKISGNPKALKRHRHSRWGTYDPSAIDKKAFAVKVESEFEGKPFKKALMVYLVFNMQRPKSHYRTGKFSHLLKESSPEHCSSKPDLDNLVKFVLDACNGILWSDDSIVVELIARKVYSDNPKTLIFIKEI